MLLTQYTDFDKWTKVATFVYIGIILSYTWVLLVLSVFIFVKVILGMSAVKRLIKWMKRKFTRGNRSDLYKDDDDSGNHSMRNFSEISYNIQQRQH